MKLKTKSFLLSLSFVFPFLVGCNGEQQTSTDVSSTDTTIITTSTFSQTSTNPADENVEGFDYYLLDDGTYCIAQGTSTLLSEITIPSLYKGRNVTQIKEEGFAGHNATTINLPNTITTICDKAFQNCSSLVSISISENICHFGNGVFNGCNNLQHNIYNNARYLGNSSNPYIILCKNLHAGITFCEIYNSCRIIYEKAFASCTSLTSIQIPDKIKSIGENAFYNCSSLKSIIIPENVVSIGKRIFEQCSFELKIYCAVEEKPSEWSDEWNSVNGMIWIGLTPLFSYLTLWGYRQIIVNEGYSYAIVEKNGTQTATIISFDEQITSFNPQSEINGIKVTQFIFYLFQLEAHHTKIKTVVLPTGLTNISYAAFAGCSEITSFIIPNSITSISTWAFNSCGSLTSIVIPSSVTNIESNAFVWCSSLTIYCEAESCPSGWKEDWNSDNRPVVWGYVPN